MELTTDQSTVQWSYEYRVSLHHYNVGIIIIIVYFILALPSAPRKLTVNLTEDSSTSGVLQWQNPSDSGLPAFNKFVVELISMTSPFINVSRTVTATSTEPSYITPSL